MVIKRIQICKNTSKLLRHQAWTRADTTIVKETPPMGVEHKTLETKHKTRTMAGKANSDRKSLSKWRTFWFKIITNINKTKHTLPRRNMYYPPSSQARQLRNKRQAKNTNNTLTKLNVDLPADRRI